MSNSNSNIAQNRQPSLALSRTRRTGIFLWYLIIIEVSAKFLRSSQVSHGIILAQPVGNPIRLGVVELVESGQQQGYDHMWFGSVGSPVGPGLYVLLAGCIVHESKNRMSSLLIGNFSIEAICRMGMLIPLAELPPAT